MKLKLSLLYSISASPQDILLVARTLLSEASDSTMKRSMSRLMELHVLSLDIWMTSLIAKFNQKLKYQLLIFLPLVNTESRENTGKEVTGK